MNPIGIGAVDIGGTKIAVGIVDGAGRILARTETPTQTAGAYPEALQRIIDMFEAEIARPTDIGSTAPRSQRGH